MKIIKCKVIFETDDGGYMTVEGQIENPNIHASIIQLPAKDGWENCKVDRLHVDLTFTDWKSVPDLYTAKK